MPQEMNILCCYSCNMYQVHIVKKSTKWQCKICGEKQSIQVVYFKGSGNDCRKEVQRLNSLKGTEEAQQALRCGSIEKYGLDCVAEDSDEIEPCACSDRAERPAGKWAKYLGSNNEDDSFCQVLDNNEHLASSQESYQSLENQEKRSTQFYSLPTTQNLSLTQSKSNDRFAESKARSSKSRTYPPIKNSQKISDKWKNYLNPKKTGFGDECRASQNKIPVSDPLRSDSKHNIFEDSDDDLDMTINF